MSPLAEAHHDGSPLYVPAGPFELDDVVPVRVRVPTAVGERAVWLRVVADGEPMMVQARPVAGPDQDRWYEADVRVHNPVTGYRVLLDVPGGYRWLNGTGTHAEEVSDEADFRLSVHRPAPEWATEAVVYQVFPDRFARSTAADGRQVPHWAQPQDWDAEPAAVGPTTGRQLYGGDLPGLAARLDHLVGLGVDTVYLTPFFPALSVHRYDATTFEHVDELLGGDRALSALSGELHARGMHLVGDLTTNHTGVGHEWFTAGDGPYYREPGGAGYVGWLGHASLPKLDWSDPDLVARMTDGPDAVVTRWLREPYALDGWRIDVANMTGRYRADDLTHEVSRRVRAAMDEVAPGSVLVAEHLHDAGADLRAGGWQATMNYAGFARPVWQWLVDPAAGLNVPGTDVPLPRRGGPTVVRSMAAVAAQVPWTITTAQWNLVGSHDTPRIATLVGRRDLHEVAAGLLLTYPGVPMIFAGDEGGLTGRTGEHARATMPWAQIDAGGGPGWDAGLTETYRRLIAVRRSSPALRSGGLRWAVVHDDALAFLRELGDERVLVLVARAPWPGAVLPAGLLAPGARAEQLYGDGELSCGPGGLALPTDGPGVQVWRLPVA